MGTIGHTTLLHELKNWQIRAALRGYYRQQRTQWETARFVGLVIASANRDPKKPPITAHDLLPLPWDRKEQAVQISDEEIEELREMMRKENEAQPNSAGNGG